MWSNTAPKTSIYIKVHPSSKRSTSLLVCTMIFGSVTVLCDKGTSDVPASVILQSKVKKKNSKITKKQKKKEKEGNKMNMYNNRLGTCLLFLDLAHHHPPLLLFLHHLPPHCHLIQLTEWVLFE